jgi:hypothetical protein
MGCTPKCTPIRHAHDPSGEGTTAALVRRHTQSVRIKAPMASAAARSIAGRTWA